MIPKSFNEFTVGQFISWHEIIETEKDVITREYKLLAMLMGITLDEAEAIPFKKIDPLLITLNAIHLTKPSENIKRAVRVNGKFYIPVLQASKLRELLSANQYTAFQEYNKEPVKNLDKILTLIYTPFKWFGKKKLTDEPEAMAKEMRDAKLGDVFGFVFFCERQYSQLMNASLPYFQKSTQEIDDHMKEVYQHLGVDSKMATDGTTS